MLDALGALKNGSLGSKTADKIKDVIDIVQGVVEAVDIRENGIKDSGEGLTGAGDGFDSGSGGGNSETNQVKPLEYSSSGDPKNPKKGDTIYTTTNNGQDTIKVDLYNKTGNSRMQTGNKRDK